MHNESSSLIAMDKETMEIHKVDSIHLPLGKPSDKDIAVISKDDSDVLEWRSIDDVNVYQLSVDLGRSHVLDTLTLYVSIPKVTVQTWDTEQLEEDINAQVKDSINHIMRDIENDGRLGLV